MPRAKNRRKLPPKLRWADTGAEHSGSECSQGCSDDGSSEDEGNISDLVDDEDHFSDDQAKVKISRKERNQELSQDELQLILENAGIECPYQNGREERKRKRAKKGTTVKPPKKIHAEQSVQCAPPSVQKARVQQPISQQTQVVLLPPVLPVLKSVPVKEASNFWGGIVGDDEEQSLDWTVQPSQAPQAQFDKSSLPLFGVFVKGLPASQSIRPKSSPHPRKLPDPAKRASESHVLRSDGTMYFRGGDGSKQDRGRITDGA